MTRLILAVAIVVVALQGVAVACKSNEIEFNGICAAMPSPISPMIPSSLAQMASDEKPPADKMPSYQREGIHADMPLPQTAEQEKDKQVARDVKAEAAQR